jgi:hypothetical protein
MPPRNQRDRGPPSHHYQRQLKLSFLLALGNVPGLSSRLGDGGSDGRTNHHGEEDAEVLGEEQGDGQV